MDKSPQFSSGGNNASHKSWSSTMDESIRSSVLCLTRYSVSPVDCFDLHLVLFSSLSKNFA
jgi:hypothetical protein